jgi:hypothetical protein
LHEWLAHFRRHQMRDLSTLAFEQVRHSHEQLGTFGKTGASPSGGRSRCGAKPHLHFRRVEGLE